MTAQPGLDQVFMCSQIVQSRFKRFFHTGSNRPAILAALGIRSGWFAIQALGFLPGKKNRRFAGLQRKEARGVGPFRSATQKRRSNFRDYLRGHLANGNYKRQARIDRRPTGLPANHANRREKARKRISGAAR